MKLLVVPGLGIVSSTTIGCYWIIQRIRGNPVGAGISQNLLLNSTGLGEHKSGDDRSNKAGVWP